MSRMHGTNTTANYSKIHSHKTQLAAHKVLSKLAVQIHLVFPMPQEHQRHRSIQANPEAQKLKAAGILPKLLE